VEGPILLRSARRGATHSMAYSPCSAGLKLLQVQRIVYRGLNTVEAFRRLNGVRFWCSSCQGSTSYIQHVLQKWREAVHHVQTMPHQQCQQCQQWKGVAA
jgi:hypothetical protein